MNGVVTGPDTYSELASPTGTSNRMPEAGVKNVPLSSARYDHAFYPRPYSMIFSAQLASIPELCESDSEYGVVRMSEIAE
jgi:hypothetical protein